MVDLHKGPCPKHLLMDLIYGFKIESMLEDWLFNLGGISSGDHQHWWKNDATLISLQFFSYLERGQTPCGSKIFVLNFEIKSLGFEGFFGLEP